MPIAIDSWTYTSGNYNDRPAGVGPSCILIHTTEGAFDGDAEWLCSTSSGVSTHYVISPAGAVFQLVHDSKRAWHAGSGSWNGCTDLNDISLGIECSHVQGQGPWPSVQTAALDELCRDKIAEYGITQEWVTAHRWYAPGRKVDPTDFPDSELKPFIAGLYGATPEPASYERTFEVLADNAIVRQGPAKTFPEAGRLYAGDRISADNWTFGQDLDGKSFWLHIESGWGFVHESLVTEVS